MHPEEEEEVVEEEEVLEEEGGRLVFSLELYCACQKGRLRTPIMTSVQSR